MPKNKSPMNKSPIGKGRSSAAAAAYGSPGLNFNKVNSAELAGLIQAVSASKPATSSAQPVEVMTFGKYLCVAQINPDALPSKWSDFPKDQTAVMKALNMKGFQFADSDGMGQRKKLCVSPFACASRPCLRLSPLPALAPTQRSLSHRLMVVFGVAAQRVPRHPREPHAGLRHRRRRGPRPWQRRHVRRRCRAQRLRRPDQHLLPARGLRQTQGARTYDVHHAQVRRDGGQRRRDSHGGGGRREQPRGFPRGEELHQVPHGVPGLHQAARRHQRTARPHVPE